MFIAKLEPLAAFYTHMSEFWEDPKTQRRASAIVLLIYFAAILGIEAKRMALLPESIAQITPDSHAWSIHLAFTLILCIEVISLVFCISDSFSRSVGKQLEILALIQLRNAFKELSHLQEPISIASNWEPVLHIGLSATGALLIFVILRLFLRLTTQRAHAKRDEAQLYVLSKKLLCLCLLGVIIGIGIRDLIDFSQTGRPQRFFETVYTALIFADITLVLLAQRYMPTFQATFRNSGFVVGTLMMRLGLSATAPLDTVISLFAGCYVLALVWVFTRFCSCSRE